MDTFAPDGAELQRRWNEVCDESAPVVADALDLADRAGDIGTKLSLKEQAASLQVLQAIANGRRFVPGEVASGLLHDYPPEITHAPYRAAFDALRRVVDLWSGGLGAPEWDWKHRGYPPGWTSTLRARLRSGLFYRAR